VADHAQVVHRRGTDLVGALKVATTQLQRSQAGRRVAVLLSDCRATVPGDVMGAVAGLLTVADGAQEAVTATSIVASLPSPTG